MHDAGYKISFSLYHVSCIIFFIISKGGFYGEEQGICKAFTGNGGV